MLNFEIGFLLNILSHVFSLANQDIACSNGIEKIGSTYIVHGKSWLSCFQISCFPFSAFMLSAFMLSAFCSVH